MASGVRSDDDPPGPRGRFADDLIGLDPNDPDVQAFAAHLDWMEKTQPAYTVEGSLAGVRDFAEGARRARGPRRMLAVVLTALMLFGAAMAVLGALQFMLSLML